MVLSNVVSVKLKILCVFRDRSKTEFHKLLFSDMGHQTSAAYNAYSALKIFQTYYDYNRPFDIVYVDYLLCGMNGISLGKRLREIDPDVPLMMLPSSLLFKSDIRREYDDFGGFLREPNSSYNTYKLVIDRVIKDKIENIKFYN